MVDRFATSALEDTVNTLDGLLHSYQAASRHMEGRVSDRTNAIIQVEVQQVIIDTEAELKKLATKYPGPFRLVRSVACAQQLLNEQLDDIQEHSSNFTARELELIVRSIRAKQNQLITNQGHFRKNAAGTESDVSRVESNDENDGYLSTPARQATEWDQEPSKMPTAPVMTNPVSREPTAFRANSEMVDDPTTESFRLKSVSRINPIADPPTPAPGAPAPAPWDTCFRSDSTSKKADAGMMEGSPVEQVAYTAM